MPQPVLLQVDGAVARPRSFTRAELAGLDAREQLPDVSVLDPKRRGQAVRLTAILTAVEPAAGVQWLTLHASADDFHASIPLADVRERAVLIFALEGADLPVAAGGPLRFFIPDHAACHSAEIDECANVKFVDRLELTVERGYDNRPHDDAAHNALHDRS